ncbi:asparagine synthase (glutamine-hydrolyzing) [Vicingus serpentipes]|uniref:asparagine synthase (glutamine-hydrolyzing) n=1 Tax=Vicingus serpentipes TaxID=1926625 RepID=A0A5C6RWN8_9FLAO|nr:asparagine synthase (glutamine-hydrolyzing) [Vicingus serpentipes]TXB66758.1 asparagine synthase (glutamine-hydrolyzing) [Vicingus serpentipes]
MCGIVGIISKNKEQLTQIKLATNALAKRGPDNQQTVGFEQIALGHARLSIIDTTKGANQPFTDNENRYALIFNGEIYNYKELKEELLEDGFSFITNSDTEVLLYLYIKYKEDCLEKLNGFFAFSVYDKYEGSLFIARDRMGIKPLLYYYDGADFIFSSELKAIFKFKIDKTIDQVSLFNYLQFNYIPTNKSILTKVNKLAPGHFIKINNINCIDEIVESQYYEIPYNDKETIQKTALNYDKSKEMLVGLLDDSVQKRLVADVPVGTFLSGGVDSSIISLLAKRHKNDLSTFSIGYKDEPFFDETNYANAVAKKIGSNHHIISLTNDELYENLNDILDYIDEPFADSSAIAVYLLSKYTKKHVTVALSGDGADEMFSGYNKHMADFKSRHPGIKESIVKAGFPIWNKLPKSRNSKLFNINRQLYKFSLGANLTNKERYWQWASILNEEKANYLLNEELVFNPQRLSDTAHEYKKRKDELLKFIRKDGDLNDVLYTDMKMVLVNDMLRKVDGMSMANSLEVRVPFLDHRIVNFAFNLPRAFKINADMKKKILQDAFKEDLPEEVYNRPKHGFEVPLLNWFKNELRDTIENDLLSLKFIEEQEVFNWSAINELKQKLYSSNPEDSHATVWALIVFNSWWKKYMND